MFNGALTASNMVFTIDSTSTLTASMTVASNHVLNGLATMSYANGVLTFSLAGPGTLLDGAVELTDITVTTTKTAAYLQGSCTGRLPRANLGATVSFKITKPATSGARPDVAITMGLPSVTFGGLASSLWPAASDVQLPDFVNTFAFPTVEVSTPNLFNGRLVHHARNVAAGRRLGPHRGVLKASTACPVVAFLVHFLAFGTNGQGNTGYNSLRAPVHVKGRISPCLQVVC